MQTYVAVIERDGATGPLVGYVPGWPGAHSLAPTREELSGKLREVLALLLRDGPPATASEAVAVESIAIP
jgi:predicted RNase H-like HicB family nuclease